jgi:Aldehyde dehydrogenase family
LTWAEAVRAWDKEVGGPPVMANVVGGPAIGEAVVDTVDMVMFTGSTATGRKIAGRAAERLIPASLELGGKDAMVVLDDCDLERAASAAAWGALWNSGQICISVERVYVEAPIYDDFVTKVAEHVGRLRQGMDPDGSFTTDVGAMSTERQLTIVERHVDDAVGGGAKVLTGGHRAEQGLFFEPTVLVDVDHTHVLHAGGDLRADAAHHEGRRRGRGRPAGQRLRLRPVLERVDHGPRPGDAGGPPARGRSGEHQQRHDLDVPAPVAHERVEELGPGKPIRRSRRDVEVLPAAVGGVGADPP